VRVSVILLSGRRLITRRPFCRPASAVFLGLSGSDGDAAFEDEVDVIADRFRASIIFRLPAPTSMYHSFALEVNPFCLSGDKRNGGESRGNNTNFTYPSYPAFPDYLWTDPGPSERSPSIERRVEYYGGEIREQTPATF